MRIATAVLVTAALGYSCGSALADVKDVRVGAMEQVQRSVYGTPPDGAEEVKRKGDDVLYAESLETRDASRALVGFIDGSNLALGAKTRVLIDEFVFDPKKAEGNAILKIAVGTMRFVTGGMPKGGTVIQTPTASLTLRGTDVTVHVHPDGTTDISVREGLVETHNKLTGATTTLGPGESQTASQAGNQDFSGDNDQYGLNGDSLSDTDHKAAESLPDNPTTTKVASARAASAPTHSKPSSGPSAGSSGGGSTGGDGGDGGNDNGGGDNGGDGDHGCHHH